MTYTTYKLLHLLGAFGLFTAFGALCVQAMAGAGAASGIGRRTLMVLHGLGATLLLISGFGILARLGIAGDIPGWAWVKIGIWLLLGGAVALPARRPQAARWLVWVVLLLGGLAAWLGLFKPF